MRIHMLIALGLLALLTAPAGTTAGTAALGTGCSGSGFETCAFDCQPFEQLFVSTHGAQTVTATCGGAAIGCVSTADGVCHGRSTFVLFADHGVCTGAGSGTFTCSSG